MSYTSNNIFYMTAGKKYTLSKQKRSSHISDSLFAFMEDCIARLKRLNRQGTATNYRAALNSLKTFRQDQDLSIRSLERSTVEAYEAFLRTRGLTSNSISFYMRILRATYNRAVGQGLTVDQHPFSTVFTGTERTLKRAISISDIKLLRALDLSLKPSLSFARDMFIFLFLCRGMAFIDAAFLKKTDIRAGAIVYRRHKTNQRLRIKLEAPISELLRFYTIESSPYLLPIIKKPGHNERKQYASALRRINSSLKIIGEMIGLSLPLTTYVSRHSWATIAKNKAIPIHVISDALGHDNVRMTQIYLASIDDSLIDKANYLIIREFY